MNKAYLGMTWENAPSTVSPIDDINLNAISRGLSTVDDRVIDLDSRVSTCIKGITYDTQGNLVMTQDDGTEFSYNITSKVVNALNSFQEQTRVNFTEVSSGFADVHQMLSDMDMRIDITAEGANKGMQDIKTVITEFDGYYRQEMSGIRTSVSNLNDGLDHTNDELTRYYSSLTQTTEAIQLAVTSVTQNVNNMAGDMEEMSAQINIQAGDIAMKVTKLQVIDDLQQEFGSGIDIAWNRITIASAGALVINTDNFKLDVAGNAEFSGTVFMEAGYVGGYPIMTVNDGGGNMDGVTHANHSWKLRSAALGPDDERYYTYMTAKKHLIVSNDERASHKPTNDVTSNCTIGSPNYPWKTGYFRKLRVTTEENNKLIKHDVIPEGYAITLLASSWQSTTDPDIYRYEINLDGIKPGESFFSIAVENDDYDLLNAYKYRLEAACVTNNKIYILSYGAPSDDVDIILIAEDYIITSADSVESPEMDAEYDPEANQLTVLWDSIDDSSNFIMWQKDELVVEQYDETNDTWIPVLTLPTSGKFKEDEFSDDPLVIGEEGDR